jgi:hypothetical protein
VRVPGLRGIVAIAAGGGHSLALASDGRVWAWGDNEWGQVGNGGTADVSSPVQIIALDTVTAIAGGEMHSLALKADGTVWAWGIDKDGQLGDGLTGPGAHSARPVQAGGLDGVTAIAAGWDHSLALQSPPFYARAEDGDERIAYAGAWRRLALPAASGRSVATSVDAQSGQASLQWTGTDLAVLMEAGPGMGMAWIVVDEQDGRLVDLYSSTPRPQQVVLARSGLPPGPHLLTIAPSGQRNAYSSGTTIALDAVDTR